MSPSEQANYHKLERFVVVAFIVVNLLIPAMTSELFPFSTFWLFADAPQQYVDFQVKDSKGQAIDASMLGLQRNYWGVRPEPLYGVRPARTIDVFGAVPTRESLYSYVQERLRERPELPDIVVVTMRTFGDDGEGGIGLRRRSSWKVTRRAL